MSASIMYPLWLFVFLKVFNLDTDTAARLSLSLSLVMFYVYWIDSCRVTQTKGSEK